MTDPNRHSTARVGGGAATADGTEFADRWAATFARRGPDDHPHAPGDCDVCDFMSHFKDPADVWPSKGSPPRTP